MRRQNAASTWSQRLGVCAALSLACATPGSESSTTPGVPSRSPQPTASPGSASTSPASATGPAFSAPPQNEPRSPAPVTNPAITPAPIDPAPQAAVSTNCVTYEQIDRPTCGVRLIGEDARCADPYSGIPHDVGNAIYACYGICGTTELRCSVHADCCVPMCSTPSAKFCGDEGVLLDGDRSVVPCDAGWPQRNVPDLATGRLASPDPLDYEPCGYAISEETFASSAPFYCPTDLRTFNPSKMSSCAVIEEGGSGYCCSRSRPCAGPKMGCDVAASRFGQCCSGLECLRVPYQDQVTVEPYLISMCLPPSCADDPNRKECRFCELPGSACDSDSDCCGGSASNECLDGRCCMASGPGCKQDADCCGARRCIFLDPGSSTGYCL